MVLNDCMVTGSTGETLTFAGTLTATGQQGEIDHPPPEEEEVDEFVVDEPQEAPSAE